LRTQLGESSRLIVSSTDSMRESHPIHGSRSSPDRVIPEPGWCSILWVGGWVAGVVAPHIAFSCEQLVAMDGNDVAGWGGELHGQVGCGDDGLKSVKGWAS